MRRKDWVQSTADDWDFFTGWRRYRFCTYGRSRQAKNNYVRRCRRQGKRLADEGLGEYYDERNDS